MATESDIITNLHRYIFQKLRNKRLQNPTVAELKSLLEQVLEESAEYLQYPSAESTLFLRWNLTTQKIDNLTVAEMKAALSIEADDRVPNGDATHLILYWNQATSLYVCKTIAEFKVLLKIVPDGDTTHIFNAWNNDTKIWETQEAADMLSLLGLSKLQRIDFYYNSMETYFNPFPDGFLTNGVCTIKRATIFSPAGTYPNGQVQDSVGLDIDVALPSAYNNTGGVIQIKAFSEESDYISVFVNGVEHIIPFPVINSISGREIVSLYIEY
jgi:hypothetical protein